MAIDIADKSFMMILLLEECNFSCPHCIREDEPIDPGYKLSFRQLQSCLSDCERLSSVRRVHFSGGEPTLWREGHQDLMDLLLEISGSGFVPGFISNGSSFCDYSQCYDFFSRYVEASTMPLHFYLSIDTFHGNFDPQTGRAPSLDNILNCKRELPQDAGDLLELQVVVVVSKAAESLLPDEMVAHYESLGVSFGFIPLRLGGKAQAMSQLCPDLQSNDPEDLGAYQRFCPEPRCKEPEGAPDIPRAPYLVLIGDDYHAHIPSVRDFRDQWHRVAPLGNLPDEIIQTYSREGEG